MSIVVLKLPDVKGYNGNRPACCPSCKGEILQRWGGRVRKLRDHQVKEVLVYRYRCCRCRHTFRHYPAGVDQAQQSQRLRKLAAHLLDVGIELPRNSRCLCGVWSRDRPDDSLARCAGRSETAATPAGCGNRCGYWGWMGHMCVVGAKCARCWWQWTWGKANRWRLPMWMKHNPHAVRRWLEPLVKRLGVSVIVTDDLASYKVVARQLDLEHQICQFHVRRWVGRTLHELQATVPKEWLWVLDEIKQLLAELPPEGGRRLFELWKQIPERRFRAMRNSLSPGVAAQLVDPDERTLAELSGL